MGRAGPVRRLSMDFDPCFGSKKRCVPESNGDTQCVAFACRPLPIMPFCYLGRAWHGRNGGIEPQWTERLQLHLAA